jgi:hypothetical protein
MKKNILDVSYMVYIGIVCFSLSVFFAFVFNWEAPLAIFEFLTSARARFISLNLNLISGFFWGYCIYYWAKHDKESVRLIMLLFLGPVYILYYYPKRIRGSLSR